MITVQDFAATSTELSGERIVILTVQELEEHHTVFTAYVLTKGPPQKN